MNPIELIASNEMHLTNKIENLPEIIEAPNPYLYRAIARRKPGDPPMR